MDRNAYPVRSQTRIDLQTRPRVLVESAATKNGIVCDAAADRWGVVRHCSRRAFAAPAGALCTCLYIQ
eukprot:878226-Prymnesium_polylepis.2